MASEHGSDLEEILKKKNISKPENMTGKFEYCFNWILNCGTSHHMTPLTSILKKIRKLDKPFYITTPIRISTLIGNMGDVNVSSFIALKDVLLVPDFKCNLISIHKLTYDLNYYVIYDQNSCTI
ncbi:hypothetical protein KIW84_051903 [Lathyrus oleraceus]|uniref:Retrovirus-related Pol polyprotein from transposon TNT 1-94-like beta-barrel domain-containing protein n=1 Tax=Pisum sativum TaxID=3888 RepID=A0A9D5AEC8_PEA|nr:hypothetical protein KIW84_051903 [Pisum sativum]